MVGAIVRRDVAAACWAIGFVAARHGVLNGLTPADIGFHRFVWSGVFLLPLVWRAGLRDLGGVGWGRGLIMMLLAGTDPGDGERHRLHPDAARATAS